MSLPLFSSFLSALNEFTHSIATAAYKPGDDSVVRAVQVTFAPEMLREISICFVHTVLNLFFIRKFVWTLKKICDQMLTHSRVVCSLMLFFDSRGRSNSNWRSLTMLSAQLNLVGVKLVSTLHFKTPCLSTCRVVLVFIRAANPRPLSVFAPCPSAQYRVRLPWTFLQRSYQGIFRNSHASTAF